MSQYILSRALLDPISDVDAEEPALEEVRQVAYYYLSLLVGVVVVVVVVVVVLVVVVVVVVGVGVTVAVAVVVVVVVVAVVVALGLVEGYRLQLLLGKGDLLVCGRMGVSTNGAAAKVRNFDGLEKKVLPGTFGT